MAEIHVAVSIIWMGHTKNKWWEGFAWILVTLVWFCLVCSNLGWVGWLGSILHGIIWLGLVWFGWDSCSRIHNLDGTYKKQTKKQKHDDMLSCCATKKKFCRTFFIGTFFVFLEVGFEIQFLVWSETVSYKKLIWYWEMSSMLPASLFDFWCWSFPALTTFYPI